VICFETDSQSTTIAESWNLSQGHFSLYNPNMWSLRANKTGNSYCAAFLADMLQNIPAGGESGRGSKQSFVLIYGKQSSLWRTIQHRTYGIAASAAISRVNLITPNKFPSGRCRRRREMNVSWFLLFYLGGGGWKWRHWWRQEMAPFNR
jgi:hypothetical protein